MSVEPPEAGSDYDVTPAGEDDSGVSSTETDDMVEQKPRRRVQRGQQSFWLKKSPTWLKRIEARETNYKVHAIRRRCALRAANNSARSNPNQKFTAVSVFDWFYWRLMAPMTLNLSAHSNE